MQIRVIAFAFVLTAVGVLLAPVGGGATTELLEGARVETMNLGSFSDAKPDASLRLLFLHHSCGGQLFAPKGTSVEKATCIYESHPNGGNLRNLLQSQGYEIHEASYASELGDKTDLFDWLPKFRNKSEKVLSCDMNDTFYKDGRKNQIVVFKSCYPNNDFVEEGSAPGNPAGPDLTVSNARATLSALLPELQKHPEVLYVYVTAPPRAPMVDKERLFKVAARKLLGRPSTAEVVARSSVLARKFDDWVSSKDGWLKDYPLKNVVVFDYYDVLTGHGASNLSKYGSEGGYDSHPSSEGNEKAAREFVPFVNRAVRRAGLAK